MNRETEYTKVAILVIEQFPNDMNTEAAEILTGFCEEENMIPIVFLREETSKGVIGPRGYQTISELIDKGLIDGVVTLSDEALEGEFGDKLVMDSMKKDFFVISYEQEMAIREEEAMRESEEIKHGFHNHGIDILTLMMM